MFSGCVQLNISQALRLPDADRGSQQDPVNARLSRLATSLVSAIPLLLAVIFLLGHVLSIILRGRFSRPQWLRNIIDSPPDGLRSIDGSKDRMCRPRASVLLLFPSLLGLLVQVAKVVTGGDRIDILLLLAGWVCRARCKRDL